MMRTIFLVLVVLHWCPMQAQQPLKFITLPTLDSTVERTAFFAIPGGGYLIGTRQIGLEGWGSTLIKTDGSGVPLSAHRIQENISQITLCSDSGYLMMGANALIKTDSDVNIQWTKRLVSSWPSFYYQHIAEHAGKHYVFASVPQQLFDPSLSFYGTHAAVVLKFDGAGALVDQVILNDTVYSSNRFNLYNPSPAFADDGTMYLSLNMLPFWAGGTCNRQPTVIKLNSDLDMVWAYRYPVSYFNSAGGVTVLRDGNLALFGSYGNNYPYCTYFRNYLQKVDSNGNVLFAKSYHDPTPTTRGTIRPIELPDSTLIFSCTKQDTLGGPVWPLIEHIGANGAVLGSKGFDHPYSSFYYWLVLADAGNGDLALCRLNTRDTLLFATVDTSLTTACFSSQINTIDSNLTITRFPFTPAYMDHAFFFSDTIYTPFEQVPVEHTIECDISTAVPDMFTMELSIYPNPTRQHVTIDSSTPVTELIVIDALGRTVLSSSPHSSHVAMELPMTGIYFLKVMSYSQWEIRKLIVE